MRIQLYAIILLLPIFSFGQEDVKIKKEITSFFAKADKKHLQDVLFFEINNKTGLIDARTNKVILSGNKELHITSLFNPKMTGYYKRYTFEIDQDFNIEVAKFPEENEIGGLLVEEAPVGYIEKKIAIEDSFKGFSVDERGNLKTWSNIYSDGRSKYVYPFKYKGKYYAVAIKEMPDKQRKYGVIDTEGNSLPGFDFIHESITRNGFATNEDDVWFIINGDQNYSCEKLLEKAFFKNINGAEKLKGELANFPTGNFFGLGANVTGCLTFSGVLDVLKMEWIVKPQTIHPITTLDYTSKILLDVNNVLERPQATIYAQIFDGHSTYYMDLNLKNKYIPSKK
jgi:hypothetical protein